MVTENLLVPDVRVNVNVSFASLHLVKAHCRAGREDVQPYLKTSCVDPVTDGAEAVGPTHLIAATHTHMSLLVL